MNRDSFRPLMMILVSRQWPPEFLVHLGSHDRQVDGDEPHTGCDKLQEPLLPATELLPLRPSCHSLCRHDSDEQMSEDWQAFFGLTYNCRLQDGPRYRCWAYTASAFLYCRPAAI